MSVKTYDPKSVAISFGGIPITGFADGSYIKISRSSDAFSKEVGAGGDVSRVKSNDNTCEVTLMLKQTADSNDYLSGIYLADQLSNAGVLPFAMKDNSGSTVFLSGNAWIRKQADAEFGKEFNTREWVLDCADSNYVLGGNLPSA